MIEKFKCPFCGIDTRIRASYIGKNKDMQWAENGRGKFKTRCYFHKSCMLKEIKKNAKRM